MNNKSGIYCIKNKINGKLYIGSSSNIHKRFISHKHGLRKNKHHNKPLQHSFNKHGIDIFDFIVLEYCDVEKLKEKEQLLLDKYFDTGILYNTFRDAYVLRKENHPMYNKHHSEESINKIRKARSKQTIRHSNETKDKISKANKNKIVSKEHIKMMVDARNGIAWNKGIKTNISPANKIDFSDEEIENILTKYNNGYSIEKIRRELNYSWDTIKTLLISQNIKIRNISEQKILNDKHGRIFEIN